MAKQLNVDLRFTANNAQAKQQIQDLQTALDKLMTTSGKSSSGLGITKDIAQATSEVAKLQAMLESSKNASGGLDLGKFNQSLAQGQVKISDYAKTLSSLGPQGDQAFAKLAKAIINAEVPLKRTNGLLKEFKTSLANTARWQLSSSMLHGFMGAVQSAYGYAQDLNESLNNIRIVTGQNIDQMATFAKEANKAAQALSTTTTEYTDASLIYYQQGLSDSEVAKRTEVTIKMANAAGQSAQIVSDQLTAVWNNFYDGSKSLEYYADVMTALGAATASSTDEIAGGLEKFAAIGETIGLSYEYAASALATITSNTRQSEEVVGTALKTIFARIQGLNLGETLDDGTSLNKYSAALEKVGISIFEQNGEIKKMDNILDEMAAKWGTLAKDQQIALAQTVAGVRQYTQLIALMDNWDAGDSDSMVANLDTAYNATGTLQEQADIYAESWEAARDRVTAAAEEIYNQLLNDEFFIDLNNGFAGFLNIVSNTIDALGGLPGVLTVASSIMFRMFGKDMAKAIDDWGYNIKLRSNEGVQEILKLRQESIEALRNVYADNVDTGPVNATSQASFESQATIADTLLVKRQQLLANGQALSEQDERQAQLLLQINEAYGEQAIASAKSLENAQKQSDLLESQARTQVRRYNNAQTDPNNKINITAELNQIKQAQIQYSALEATFNKLSRAKSNFNSGDEMIQALRTMSDTATAAGMDMTAFEQVLAKLSTGMSVDEVLNAIETEMNQIGDAAYNNIEKVNGLREKLQQIGMSDEQINKLIASWERQGIITSEVAENLRNVKVQGDEAAAAINQMQGPPPTVGQKFMAVANTISNIAMSISAVKGLIDTWNNDDMSFGEKLLSTFTTLGMVIPMVTTALTGNNLALLGSASSSIVAALGFKGVDIAAKMAAGGVGALWAALWPIALVAAAVAAAIAILVATVKGISNAYNADAIAAEQAEKAASNLADAYNEAKQEYQDMIAAMDNYKSARDALDNLTEGTKEYEAALKEANRAALELINKYGLIEGQDYNWEGDQLVIKDDAMDRVSSAKEAEMDKAYAASQMASASAKAARSKADLTEARRDIRDENGLGDGDRVWQGVVNGITAAIGVALAPATGGLSLAATALAAGAALNSDMKAAEMDAAITKAVEAAREDQNLFDTKEAMAKALNIDINDTKLVDALWANQEEIKSLAQEMNAAEAAWKLAAQNSANEILNNNEIVQNSENANEVMAAGGKMYGTAYDAAYKTYLEDAKSRGWFNTGNADSKAAFEEYAKEAGLDQLKNFKVTNYKGDGTVEYKYIDENGTEQKKVATAEEIAATLAAAKAAEQLGASAENLVKVFNSLDASGQAFDQAMKNFLSTGDFENSTRGEATELIKQVDSGGDGVADSAEVTTYLGNQFGGDNKILDDEEAKQYGYESAQAMIDSFTKELANIDKAWDSIQLPDNIVGLDNMSLKTAQAIENSFNEINLGPAGAKAGEDYVNGINKMVAGLSEKDQTEAIAQLATIDWSSWDAMDQAKQIMKEFGVEIDLTSDEWQKFATDMRIAAGATPDFSRLKTDLNEITGILQDLDFGDTISDEDYQRLVEYNNEWERFFILQADGSRKFIGNAAQMQEITRENIRQQRQELAERRQIQKDFANVGWGHTDENGNRVKADWANKSGKDTTTAQSLLDAGGATEAALNTLGYSDQVIQEILDKANSSNAEIAAQGEAQLKEMYSRIAEFEKENMDEMDAQFAEMIASTATNMAELNAMMDSGEITKEAWEGQAAYLESVAAQNAATLAELDAVVSDFNLNGLDESYTQNLMRIAEGYESCADELANYKAALTAFTLDESNAELKEQLALAEDNLRAMIRLEEGAEEYGLEVKSLTAQSKRLAKAYGLSAEEAANMAIKNQRMNKGVQSLNDNWKDWKKQLSSSNKLTQDYADALVDCTAAIADLVGASQDLELPDEFFTPENFELIEKAMRGDIDAINSLGLEVGATTVKAMEFNAAFGELISQLETWDGEEIDITLNEQQFLADQQLVLQGIEDIKNGVISADQAMSDDWVAALNRMAMATGMSVEEMNGLLGSLGVQAKVETTYVPQKMQVPTYTDQITNLTYRRLPVTKINAFTGMEYQGYEVVPEYTKATVPGPPVEVEGFAAVAQISTVDNPLTAEVTSTTASGGSGGGGSSPAATYRGSGSRGSVAPSVTKPSGGGGGGKDKEKEEENLDKKTLSKRSDYGERYHTINKQIENLSREMEKASKSADKLWSRKRLAYLDEQNAKLDEELELLRQKDEEAQGYLETDLADLEATSQDLGIKVDIGEDGEILNFDDIVDTYARDMMNLETAYNNATTEAGQEQLQEEMDALQEKIDAFEDAKDRYYDTLDVMNENEERRQEIIDEQMQNNFDKWSGELELDIEINERDLELLEYYLSKTEDNVYAMAEAAALMVGALHELGSGNVGGQMGEFFDNLSIYNTKLEELNQKLAKGEITEAAYEEGLEEIRAGLMDNLSSIQELDKAMLSYYSDTLSAVSEEMDKYTAKMEHQTSVLEHYSNMMDILGKSKDYESMGSILQGQAETLENELAVAEAEYNLYAQQAEEKRALYEQALAEEDYAAAEIYKKEWEAADEAAMEAQSNMLDKTEQWAEAMKAVVENKLAGLAQTLEQSLTGGSSFEQINTQLERAASLQEEYLTTTNQIYETNKLMRTAQQEIDKSTNLVAKQRLKDFIKETDQLQNKSKLSKYELDIQKAKYDLLLAELALEDAQNAKSTVRLQRDSEGNFGYVYTADQSQLAQAQQQLEDAQNSLYNIGLEGANSYTEKYNQTMQEMYDTLTSITQAYYNGEIASHEEYEEQMLAAQEYYYEQLENFQDLYGVALQTDTRVIADAWSTGMGVMKIETRTWKDAVTTYTGEATATLVNWYNTVDSIAQKTGLDNIASKVKAVTDESKALKEAILGNGEDKGVIGALTEELQAVSDLTGGYANLRTTIQGLIADYEELLESVVNAQNAQEPQGSGNGGSSGSGGDSGSNGNNGGSNSGGDSSGGGNSGGNGGTGGSGSGNGGSGSGQSSLSVGKTVTVKSSATHFTRDGGNGTKMKPFVPGSDYEVISIDGEEVCIGRNNQVTGWVKKTDLVGFKTGGYTGSWGPYGKLGILDEKELILNQGDTANFLASMEVLERILEIIDLQAMNNQLGGRLSTPGIIHDTTTQTLEQSVHIEASFPGVQDRFEIEEAFNTLVNKASQYANRK